MTPAEQHLWSQYSCVPRSIIELANRNGKPISVDDYVDRFRSTLELKSDMFGLMLIVDAINTAIQLGLCSKYHHIAGPELFRLHLRQFRGTSTGILVTTHREVIQGKWAELNHCRLVTSYNKSEWQVDDVGPDQIARPAMLSDQYLMQRNAQFFHLYQ